MAELQHLVEKRASLKQRLEAAEKIASSRSDAEEALELASHELSLLEERMSRSEAGQIATKAKQLREALAEAERVEKEAEGKRERAEVEARRLEEEAAAFAQRREEEVAAAEERVKKARKELQQEKKALSGAQAEIKVSPYLAI